MSTAPVIFVAYNPAQRAFRRVNPRRCKPGTELHKRYWSPGLGRYIVEAGDPAYRVEPGGRLATLR